jgi:hypothetical protein
VSDTKLRVDAATQRGSGEIAVRKGVRAMQLMHSERSEICVRGACVRLRYLRGKCQVVRGEMCGYLR